MMEQSVTEALGTTRPHKAGRVRQSLAAALVAASLGIGAVAGATPATAAPITAPVPAGVLEDTGQFAFCLGGFGVAAGPIVTGFFFGGPGGAVKAAQKWIPKLGPVGGATVKSCMWSIFRIRV